jgi:hypothetical protein
MKKTIIGVLLTLFCSTVLAENKITASDVTIKPGETAVLTVSIENEMNVAAFDFRLYLPEGITVEWDKELMDYAWEWCERVPSNSRGSFFNMNPMVTDDGSLLFGANSGTSGKVLDGNNGPVLNITLRATTEAVSGIGQLKLISFSNENGTQSYTPEDVTFNITVNSSSENKMTANNVSIKTNETANLTVSIENTMNVAAFDFRLYLPAGITVVWDDDLKDYAWEWCDRVPSNSRGSFFSMTPMETDDGSLLFGANSGTSGKVLDGNSGPVLVITLQAQEGAKSGTGQLKRISLSNENGTQSETLSDVTFNIIVNGDGINDIKQDELDANIYNLAGQRLSKPQRGVNIKNGKKILVK